ncbi:hypothetical protein SISNIDRAFT_490969 [Sistotremastrum niveocremeum HHB9708]|uniref:Transcription factor domain-containing protein n=1 Tax=Sistotremastrum niveocremeum HHB9708 TaxID=1314777 RepID=A0A164NA90_9AGAM|nr:hypothetical protein SISNIDRAFT_490969 [Sistotremastrum niveocremeum HHB9708]
MTRRNATAVDHSAALANVLVGKTAVNMTTAYIEVVIDSSKLESTSSRLKSPNWKGHLQIRPLGYRALVLASLSLEFNAIRLILSVGSPGSSSAGALPLASALAAPSQGQIVSGGPIGDPDIQSPWASRAPSPYPNIVHPVHGSPIHPATWEQLKQVFLHHINQIYPIVGLGSPFDQHTFAFRTTGYLLGSTFDPSSPLSPPLITASAQALHTALASGSDIMDLINSSYLLAFHSYTNGRLLEGMYHAGAADEAEEEEENPVAGTSRSNELWSHPSIGTPVLLPARNMRDREMRIRTFWQVFYLDQCWSVALGALPLFTNGSSNNETANLDVEISTPWPGQAYSEAIPGSSTNIIARLCGAVNENLPNNTEAILAQAAAVFKRASSLSLEATASPEPGTDMSPEFWTQYASLEQAIRGLSSRIPPLAGGGIPALEADTRLVTAHTMVHTTLLHLYHPFVNADGNVRENSLAEARLILGIIHGIEPRQFEFLDPLLGTMWMSTAGVFIREMSAVRSSNTFFSLEVMEGLHAEYQVVVGAMKRLARVFPIVETMVQRVEEFYAASF